MRPFCMLQEKPLIELIFPQSDVKEHLMDKLFTYRNRCENPASVLPIFNFYESLDAEHQIWFDMWFNNEVLKTEAKTIPHTISLDHYGKH